MQDRQPGRVKSSESLNDVIPSRRSIMTGTIDDITITFEEDGMVKTKELDKKILTKGAWTTIMFKYQDFDAKLNDFGPVKYSIRRYQKTGGVYKFRSKFNISHAEQAQQIIDILTDWIKK